MAWTISPSSTSTDARSLPTLNGPSLMAAGPFYVQYGAVTVGNSVVQTSLLSGSAVDLSFNQGGASPAKSLGVYGPALVQRCPHGSFPLGTTFRVLMTGSIKNDTSTPTVKFDLVLKNAAGTIISTPVTSTGNMVSTGAAVVPLRVEMIATVTAIGASGSITGCFISQYGDGAVLGVMGAVPAAVACDLTQQYYMDIMVTWGTAHANDTLTVNTVVVELVG